MDDKGQAGSLAPDAHFFIMGDMNADPVDGDSTDDAALQFKHPRINQSVFSGLHMPYSAGGVAQKSGANPGYDTSTFGLRVDYVLPSAEMVTLNSGVFWPLDSDTGLAHLVATDPETGFNLVSDHRMVWVDIMMPEAMQ